MTLGYPEGPISSFPVSALPASCTDASGIGILVAAMPRHQQRGETSGRRSSPPMSSATPGTALSCSRSDGAWQWYGSARCAETATRPLRLLYTTGLKEPTQTTNRVAARTRTLILAYSALRFNPPKNRDHLTGSGEEPHTQREACSLSDPPSTLRPNAKAFDSPPIQSLRADPHSTNTAAVVAA